MVINPGDVHGGHAATETGYSYRMVYPEAAALQRIAQEITGQKQDIPYFPTPVIEDHHLARLLRHFHVTLEEPRAGLERETLFQDTLAQLIMRHAAARAALPAIGNEPQAIRLTREYLEAHATENVSLAELSRIANLSPFYLVRVFRKVLGMSPHAYLIHLRIQRAKTLLARHSPLLDVALETGFVDQSHLTKHFKRLVGVTPGHYAHRHRP